MQTLSVVIPAHDEGAVIDRCLKRLTAPGTSDLFEIVVVCNGCSDDTADRARSYAGVQVIETDIASKPHALRLGDERAKVFPRVYLDADVEVDAGTLVSLRDAFDDPAIEAAAPQLDVELANRPWTIRAFYDTWTRLPYVTDQLLGCGLFALSEEAKDRLGPFPDLIGDDEWVRRQIAPANRSSLQGHTFTIHPPFTLRELIGIEARRRDGNDQLDSQGDHAEDGGRQRQALLDLVREPARWPGVAVYVGTRVATVVQQRRRARSGASDDWHSDRGSRDAATQHSTA